MSSIRASSCPSPRSRPSRNVLAQAGMVSVLGLVFGFLGNMISPVGLKLGRDHFASAQPPSEFQAETLHTTAYNQDSPSLETSNENPHLGKHPLQRIDFEEASRLFESSSYLDGRVAFVDARNATSFRSAHIPGAYLLDRFYLEDHLPDVLPAILTAEQVVVYCGGGECEDSEYTAVLLIDVGVPEAQLRIYSGGINEWRARGGPVKRGERLSAQLEPNAL